MHSKSHDPESLDLTSESKRGLTAVGEPEPPRDPDDDVPKPSGFLNQGDGPLPKTETPAPEE